MRSIHLGPDAWEDFLFWLGGIPEPPKGDLSGYWSRRIDDQHRLVHRADDAEVKILKARYRYIQ